jgi:hypothetical protein
VNKATQISAAIGQPNRRKHKVLIVPAPLTIAGFSRFADVPNEADGGG